MINTLKFGFELYEKFNKNKEIKIGLKSTLYRELQFNIAILNEIEKNKNKNNFLKLITLFKNDFYETLITSFIDIKKIIKEKEININSLEVKNKNFLICSNKIETNIDLIEKNYFRINILKSLAIIDINKRKDSYQYLKFLMLILKKELDSER